MKGHCRLELDIAARSSVAAGITHTEQPRGENPRHEDERWVIGPLETTRTPA
jgi:hypothetical protein